MGDSVRIGVVLSSGGVRGVYAHTGFMQALERIGIEPAAISGCSAGALVGGIYASGTPMDQWSEALASMHPRDFWQPDSWVSFLWSILVRRGRGYTGMSSNEAAIRTVQRHLTAKTFEACQVPFYSLAMNLTRATKTLFSTGELATRMVASAAVPIFHRPVEIDGELYCDGAIIELSPPEAICCKHKLDALILHHTQPHHEGAEGMKFAMRRPWTIVEIIQRLLHPDRPWYLSDQPVDLRHCRCGCGAPIVVIEPDLPELPWPPGEAGLRLQAASCAKAFELLNTQLHVLKPRVAST